MNKCPLIDKLTLIIVSLAFTVTDWTISPFTFGDILLFLGFMIILIRGQLSIKTKQALIFFCTLSIVFINVIANLFFNPVFLIDEGLISILKVSYYLIIIISLYNYIRSKKLELEFIKVLNITAALMCIIGIYISLAIYSSGILPYEFFWKFTRMDVSSYIYKGYEMSSVRARSIFSEPAHLGFYLNFILGINYFNKSKHEINKISNILITVTVLLTFSYSSVLVLLLMKIMYYWNIERVSKLIVGQKYIVGILILAILIFAFWGTIEKTLIERTTEALSGGDGSAKARVFGSWDYINKGNILMGNGIGNTPEIYNVYAYILSDLGLVSFTIFCLMSLLILFENFKIGMLFIILNFQKGGYLASGYWILLLILFLYLKEVESNMETPDCVNCYPE
ncbi:hypothetical protein [Proteiniborus sp. MB09-C3]|uniref:hypothetical protein n=1 Tax=Proteiniborus sp. MB09-C3 TaxID=3050072 RepID=UPI002554DF3C|nr:hypothetical protein [Proteiniborus sp. MB09-C3]WIV12076.1 hypothetical protein QO263_18575 [Proteiniborus sp. MB09-C3]